MKNEFSGAPNTAGDYEKIRHYDWIRRTAVPLSSQLAVTDVVRAGTCGVKSRASITHDPFGRVVHFDRSFIALAGSLAHRVHNECHIEPVH
ncbi:hypothetical protein ZHAS_00020016 [Anopheles sinensis]|uniref:Uncharacterized protein n=1 Tax=Anopheles sinensis TaxID=74873 RepID=A0A084WNR6_ANOSI|nr:hypothetical protein ZHAS_00020016 [Anopheles sinensis]